MNLNNIIINEILTTEKKLNLITEKREKITPFITNRKKLKFNPYYLFRDNFDDLTPNDQWKELTLAMELIKFTKYWNRRYLVQLTDKIDTRTFVEAFIMTIHQNKANLFNWGIPYCNNGYVATIKTVIGWMNILIRKQLISREEYNDYMVKLEKEHPLWIEERQNVNKNTVYFKKHQFNIKESEKDFG